jgi:hypothetical protein
MTTATYRTFSTKGLSDNEVKFLAEVERLFLEGAKVSFDDLMITAFEAAGFQKGTPEAKECLHAWEYWQFLRHPLDRSSLITPVKLSRIFGVAEPNNSFWVRVGDGCSVYATPKLDYLEPLLNNSLVYDFTPRNFYFEIINGALYLKYQSIIGSRYIADVENDLFN